MKSRNRSFIVGPRFEFSVLGGLARSGATTTTTPRTTPASDLSPLRGTPCNRAVDAFVLFDLSKGSVVTGGVK